MFDNRANQLVKPLLVKLAKPLVARNISADLITILGFGFGVLAIAAIALGYPLIGLIGIIFNRLADGVDGAIARLTRTTDAGGYLDIVLDFIFYAGVGFAFLIMDPAQNSIAAAFLLLSFTGTGSSFLAFAIMAERYKIAQNAHVSKSMHYFQGITEGTETIAFFVLCCLFPAYFPVLASIFALLCFITTATRIIDGYRLIQIAEKNRSII